MIAQSLSMLPFVIGLPIGMAAGWLHFTTLHWSVRLLTKGLPGRALALQGVRLGALALVFFVLARLGPWALLPGAAGLLIARFAVLRHVRVSP